MESLLLVANDLFYQYEHRIKPLTGYLEAAIPLRKVSLVPPGLSGSGTQAPPGAFLRGWTRRIIAERQAIIWPVRETIAVRRTPLPGPLGPLANLAVLRRALRGIASADRVALAQGPVPGMACLSLGIRVVYDHADDYGGGRVGTLHRKLLGRWQHKTLQNALAVSCAGPSLHRHAVEAGARSACLHPNGVSTEFFGLPRSESSRPSILYFGGIEPDCGLDMVMHSMKLMDRGVSLVVGGEGSAMRRFIKLAERLGISSRITWHGGVPREVVPELLSRAWVGLAVLPPTRWNRSAFHLKILEYMAAGLPFVTTPVGDGAQIARETGAGRVAGHDPAAVAACLQSLLGDRVEREEMSHSGRNAATAYDWSLVGPRFARWVVATLAEAA